MNSPNRSLLFPLAAWLAFGAVRAQVDTTPEDLRHTFSGTGTSVPNLASAPPDGHRHGHHHGRLDPDRRGSQCRRRW